MRAFPRFSDEPLRWPPELGEPRIDVSVASSASHALDLRAVSSTFVERTHDFHCVTTWSYRGVSWGGFVLAELLAVDLGIDLEALPPFAAVYARDNRHAVYCTEDLVDPSVILATEHDGELLGRRHGGSVRLVSPKQYGYKSAKHVKRIEFVHEQPESSFGSKEHLRARVELEERHSSLPNWLLRVPYRLSVVPTALVADAALRKAPSEGPEIPGHRR